MACGTPCVTTDVGDAADIVGKTGWAVPPQNQVELARGVSNAQECWMDTPALWGERQQAARARIAKQFSIEKMVSAYAAVCETESR
jgi:glycosyltransferase involved in cell wall biosynthesis